MVRLVQWICIALLFVSPSFFSNAQEASWSTLSASGNPTERHENGFVAYNGKLYLMGGRSSKPVQIFDPETNTWTNGANPGFQMHHFQAVVFNDLIYVIGAYSGTCCDNEFGISNVWTYNPQTDQWNEGDEIPSNRRRGSTGAVVYNNKIYIIGGLEGGHGSGSEAFNWFDEYDPATGQWKIMPDAPRKRDHFHAVLHGNKIYLTGGRDTSHPSIVGETVSEVDVYDFGTGTWSTLSNSLPTPRGGTTSVLYRGEILVIGGESLFQDLAYSTTEALDPVAQTWNTLSALNAGRHGTQATVLNDAVYIAAGAAQKGGEPELNSIEKYQDESEELSSFSQVLKNNWNLLSLPLTPTSTNYADIYSAVDLSGSAPYIWNGSEYEQTTNLDTGMGFWLKLTQNPSSVVQTTLGNPIDFVQYALDEGWHLIAPPSCDNVPIFESSTSPSGAIAEGLTYFYEIGGYKPAFSFSFPRGILSRGKAYWVFATTNATLTLSCSAGKGAPQRQEVSTLDDPADTFGYVTVRDMQQGQRTFYFGSTLLEPERIISYQLPPKGPKGEFDVRYADGTRLAQSNQAILMINDANFPLSLSLDKLPAGKEGVLTIEEMMLDGTILQSHVIASNQNLELFDESITYVRITFDESEVLDKPMQFALHGNYPNPFNPTTRITFDVPVQGDVTLRVIDMLGREVHQETFSDMAPSHNQSISFDASALPAGIYVYSITLQTDKQSMTHSGRMVLLK